jgi:hypothetical protein
VTGTYSDGSTTAEGITAANITGFNSAVAATDQVLTLTVGAQTTTYKVQIVDQAGDYTYTVTDGEAQITGYTGAGGDIIIPGALAGYPVTSIGDQAFFGCTGLTSISIPQGVTSIGNWAFGGCPSLTGVSIPESVTSIGDGAFYSCPNLTTISLPQGIINIGSWAFGFCGSLIGISIPESVTNIGAAAFYDCTSLNSITFNSATTSIYDLANAIPTQAKIIGYDPSTAKDYATKYNRLFEAISTTNTLQSIAITTPATKLSYNIGDTLDITGLVVTGTYSDGSTTAEGITATNITGFNSATAVVDQVLTITVGGKTTTYAVTINAPTPSQVAFDINSIPNNTLKLGDDFFDMSSEAMNDPQATILIASLLKDGLNKNKALFKFGGKWYAPFDLTEQQFLNPAYALTDVQVNAITGFNKWYKAGSEIVDLRPGTYTITSINQFSAGFRITANNVQGAAYFNVYKKSNSTLINAVPMAIGNSLNSMPAVFGSISDLEVWIYSDAAGTNKIVELKLEGSSNVGILDYK